MAYVEDNKVVIHAFHDADMERIFINLGIWEQFNAGEMKCMVCDTVLTMENFSALVPYKGEVCGTCSIVCTLEAQRMMEVIQ